MLDAGFRRRPGAQRVGRSAGQPRAVPPRRTRAAGSRSTRRSPGPSPT